MINFSKQYNRLFAIGCSFTYYRNWPTWAPALAYELNVPLYNLGETGASNQYIAQQLFLLDSHFKLTENDIVIVQWTGHTRHSKMGKEFYDWDLSWKHTGNINEVIKLRINSTIKESLTAEDPTLTYNTLLLQSLTSIKSAILYQNTLPCTCVNLQMEDVIYESTDESVKKIMPAFVDIASSMLPSFLNVLYPAYNSYAQIMEQYVNTYAHMESTFPHLMSPNRKRLIKLNTRGIKHKNLLEKKVDVHPLPSEHIIYLENVLNHKFKKDIVDLALSDEDKFFNEVLENQDQQVARFTKSKNTLIANKLAYRDSIYDLERTQAHISLPVNSFKNMQSKLNK